MKSRAFHPERAGAAVAVGPLESDVLDALWMDEGFQPVGDVHRRLTANGREISYSAVKAVLNNLTAKEWLEKRREGKITLFRPIASREQFESIVMSNVIQSLKRNFGTPLLAHFVDELAVDDETLNEMERLLAKRKAELGK